MKNIGSLQFPGVLLNEAIEMFVVSIHIEKMLLA